MRPIVPLHLNDLEPMSEKNSTIEGMSDQSSSSLAADASALKSVLDSLNAQEMSTQLKDSSLLGFDTETTGVGPNDAIISASLVLRNPATGYDGDVKASWVMNPHRHISQAASQVNGFSDAQVHAHGMEPSVGLPQIASLIAQAQNLNIPLLAYNAPFDVMMLQRGLHHWNLPGLGALMTRMDLLVVDPLVLDRAASDRHGRRTLSDSAQYYGVSPHGDFHDASTDTIAAIDLIAPMCAQFEQIGQIPLSDLMTRQRAMHAQWTDRVNQWRESHGKRPFADQWL
jgi:DNA polymerase-3 subunit epsilon